VNAKRTHLAEITESAVCLLNGPGERLGRAIEPRGLQIQDFGYAGFGKDTMVAAALSRFLADI